MRENQGWNFGKVEEEKCGHGDSIGNNALQRGRAVKKGRMRQI